MEQAHFTASKTSLMNAPKTPLAKTEIALLEPFVGLDLTRIFVVRDGVQAAQALAELIAAGEVGFDTESKPTFRKGEKSEGPHVLQFSTLEKAFIFQSHVPSSLEVVMELLKSEQVQKIGFGLGGDLTQISQRFGIRPSAVVDLDRSFRALGYRNPVGAKSAIAMLFNRKLAKSKSVTTSNWSAENLSDAQLVYAANDAYAALRVHHALQEAGEAK
jgi:ribonuclease D